MARTLNIKSLVPRKGSPYREGYFFPENPEKYVGDPSKIIFRSSWERKFCGYCDLNTCVVCWSSETIKVPYFNSILKQEKIYNVDFYMKVKQADGAIKEFLIEVKPSKKLVKPVLPKKNVTEKRYAAFVKQMKEYIINMNKFSAAKQWAADRGWEFLVVTEKFLY